VVASAAAGHAADTNPSPSQPSPAASPVEPARVVLLDVSPATPTSEDTLTLSGTVTNGADTALTTLNAYLRLSLLPTVDRDELARLVAPEFRGGFRPGTFVPLGPTLAPGASVSFRLEVPVVELGFPSAGVYPVGVEILAGLPDGTRGTAGRAMTVVPWLPTDQPSTDEPLTEGSPTDDDADDPEVGVAVVVPLTAPVDLDTDGFYRSEQLGASFASDGALRGPLTAWARTAGATSGEPAIDAPTDVVTWLADPAVLEAAADMADGYAVRPDGPGSAVTPGAHVEDAATWLRLIAGHVRAGSVTLLPYGNVDLVALVRAGLDDDARSALQAAAEVAADALTGLVGGPLGQLSATTLAYPPAGLLDDASLRLLSAAGVRNALLSAAGLEIEQQGRARVDIDGVAVSAVVLDVELSAILSAPIAALTARQLTLAHTALAALDQKAGSSSGGVVVVPESVLEQAAIGAFDALTGGAPWMRPEPIADAFGDAPAAVATLDYPAVAAAGLDPSYLQQVAALRAATTTVTSLLGESAADAGVDRARLRAESAGWRDYPEAAEALVAEHLDAAGAALGQVRIVTAGTVTLSSDSGRFPLTVANDLDQAVTIQLSLTPRTPARLQTSAAELVEIAAGAKTTVDVSATTTANGVYLVDARLSTPEGAAFGAVTAITVRATQYDTVAWIVMGVAGGLVLVGSGLRLARRARTSRQSRAAEQAQSDLASGSVARSGRYRGAA